MASKKNAYEASKIAPKVNPREGRPAYLKPQPQCQWLMLQPKSKRHAPVKAWVYRTADGWVGWLEARRTIQVKPTVWSAEMWDEVEADGTTSGQVEVSVISVNTRGKGKGKGKAK